MPSTTISRRRLLAASGSCLSVALAGCSGAGEGRSGSTSEHHATEGRPIESTHGYEVRTVRSTSDEAIVYETEADAERATEDDDRPARSRRSTVFVTDEDAAAELHIETNADDAAEIRSFVEATDFDDESIVIDQRPIDDCYRRRVLGVQASDDDFHVRYCQSLKAATTPCEADTELVEAIVIRLHRPYEERPSSSGSSESHSCHGPRSAADGESAANETDDSNATVTEEVDDE